MYVGNNNGDTKGLLKAATCLYGVSDILQTENAEESKFLPSYTSTVIQYN